jgi:hypothetical protein
MSCLFFSLVSDDTWSLDKFEDGDEFIGLVLCVFSTWGDRDRDGVWLWVGGFCTISRYCQYFEHFALAAALKTWGSVAKV